MKYVVSPNGIVHLVNEERRRDPTGYYRTFCGRLADRGWSQAPRVLSNVNSVHLCRVCKRIREEVMSKQIT